MPFLSLRSCKSCMHPLSPFKDLSVGPLDTKRASTVSGVLLEDGPVIGELFTSY